MSDIEEDYEIIKEIGKGNYGIVYLAKDLETEDEFAIKSITKELISRSCTGISSIVNEINILRKLNHPNIITIYKVYETETHVHLVLDYASHGNLKDKIKGSGPLSEEIAISLTEKLLYTLSYIHSENIVHRDVKLENILLVDDEYNFKICDFGLACEIQDLQNLRCGTPGYIAPEILKKENYGFKADIYSLGICVYYILTGRIPFYGNKIVVLLQNRHNNINFADKRLTKSSVCAIRSMTSIYVNDRPTAKEALELP